MAIFNKVNSFSEALAEKVHNLGSDTLTVALCAATHAPVATNTVLANLTQISYTNLSARAITTSTSAQTSGTYKLVLNNLTLSATGNVATFRYVAIYNDTATNDELIGWYDNGSDVSLTNGDNFIITFDSSNGFMTLA